MKKVLYLLIALIISNSIFAQKWQPVTVYGQKGARRADTLVLMAPTGCGGPATLSAVDSALNQGAFYFDSCAHRWWGYDPKTKSWDSLHLGTSSSTAYYNVNVGSGYRLAIPNTNNIKTLGQGYGVLLDTGTSNQVGIKWDSATAYLTSLRRKDSATNTNVVGYVTPTYLSAHAPASRFGESGEDQSYDAHRLNNGHGFYNHVIDSIENFTVKNYTGQFTISDNWTFSGDYNSLTGTAGGGWQVFQHFGSNNSSSQFYTNSINSKAAAIISGAYGSLSNLFGVAGDSSHFMHGSTILWATSKKRLFFRADSIYFTALPSADEIPLTLNVDKITGRTVIGTATNKIGNDLAKSVHVRDSASLSIFGDSYVTNWTGYYSSFIHASALSTYGQAASSSLSSVLNLNANYSTVRAKDLVLIMQGYNDLARGGSRGYYSGFSYVGGTIYKTPGLQQFLNSMRSFIADWYLDSAYSANDAAITYTGTWNTSYPDDSAALKSVYISSGHSKQSTTSGATATFYFNGPSLVIGFASSDGTINRLDSFTVAIDGVTQGTYCFDSTMCGIADSGPGLIRNNRRGAACLVYLGLTNANHTAVVTKGTNTSKPLVIDYFGDLLPHVRAKPMIVAGCPRMSQYAYNAFTSLSVSAVNEGIVDMYNKALTDEIRAWQPYPVAYTDINAYWKYPYPNDISSDSVHPNNNGHYHIAQAFMARTKLDTTNAGLLPLIGNQGQLLQVSNGSALWKYDTTTLVTFSAGARLPGDTALFTDSTLYGSFYLDGDDTLIITKVRAVLNGGTSDTLGYNIWYNDTINVIGSPMFSITEPVNSTSTGNLAENDDYTGGSPPFKIPPGNWVWLKTPTVVAGRKPHYVSISLIGYKKRVN